MPERIWGALRKNALYKSTYTLLYFTIADQQYLARALSVAAWRTQEQTIRIRDSATLVPKCTTDSSAVDTIAKLSVHFEENNLKLNCSKSKEIIFTGRGTRIKPVIIPPPCINICQVRSTSRRLGGLVSCSTTNWQLLTTSVFWWHPARALCTFCEYFVIIEYLQTLDYKTYISCYCSRQNNILCLFMVRPLLSQRSCETGHIPATQHWG